MYANHITLLFIKENKNIIIIIVHVFNVKISKNVYDRERNALHFNLHSLSSAPESLTCFILHVIVNKATN